VENRAADPDQLIERAMWRIAPWEGNLVVDLGAGTGFHLPRFHDRAAHVIGIEPHAPSRLRAMARCAALGLERASIMTGSAEQVLKPFPWSLAVG
jgi:tRNA G46 methylase TrmB